MPNYFEDDEDDEFHDEIWDEIGYIEEASKRLIHNHEAEYRKIVEEIDINRLHSEIAHWKGEVYKRDREITQLKKKNPRSVHVPALEVTVALIMADNERLRREEK